MGTYCLQAMHVEKVRDRQYFALRQPLNGYWVGRAWLPEFVELFWRSDKSSSGHNIYNDIFGTRAQVWEDAPTLLYNKLNKVIAGGLVEF